MNGKYRELVRIVEVTTTSDAAGGFTGSERVKGDTFATIKPKMARTVSAEGAIVFTEIYDVTIRFVMSINPKIGDVVLYKGRRYTVQGVLPASTWDRELKFTMVTTD